MPNSNSIPGWRAAAPPAERGWLAAALLLASLPALADNPPPVDLLEFLGSPDTKVAEAEIASPPGEPEPATAPPPTAGAPDDTRNKQ